jgi:hypothetical protein
MTNGKCVILLTDVYTRHMPVMVFIILLVKVNIFIFLFEEDCECKKCNQKVDKYHFLCCEHNTLSLHKVAKATEEAEKM